MSELFPSFKRGPLAFLLIPWRVLRWFGRGIRRRRRVLLWLLAALVAVHLIATLVTGLMLHKEIERQRSEGYLLTVDQLAPKVPQGEKNAADVYQKAFDALRLSKEDEEKLQLSMIERAPVQDVLARKVIANNTEYLKLLHEASHIPACAFPVEWSAGPEMIFLHSNNMRTAARMLYLDAYIHSQDGRVNEALNDCTTMLRIAEHMKLEPLEFGQIVAYAIQKISIRALGIALSLGEPSQVAARDLINQISSIDQVSPSMRAFKGDVSLLGFWIFEHIRKGSLTLSDLYPGFPHFVARFHRTIFRPFLNLDELQYLQITGKYVDISQLVGAEAQRRGSTLKQAFKKQSKFNIITQMMISFGFTRTIWYRDNTTASLGAAQIALALVIYKSEHGSYPNSLTILEQAGFKLPTDSWSGNPFKYRREGAGFVVYSVGEDLKDQEGLPPYWDTPEKLAGLSRKEIEQKKKHYDIPFRCTR